MSLLLLLLPVALAGLPPHHQNFYLLFYFLIFSIRNSIMSLLLLLLPVALAGLPPHHQKLVDRFGAENVNFDKNVRTAFCDSCMEITVESNGGAQEHQPNRLGRFTRDGSLWENMVPFWT